MNPDNNNKTNRRDRLRLIVNGMKLHLQNLTALTIAGVVYKTSDIIAQIEGDIASSDKAEAGRAVWLQQVADERASHKRVNPLVHGVEQYVRLTFENGEGGQAILGDFGMKPRKQRTPSVAKKNAAAEKRKATREARHTMGAVQKSGIHGEPAPSPEPAQPGPAPAGVPAAPGAK